MLIRTSVRAAAFVLVVLSPILFPAFVMADEIGDLRKELQALKSQMATLEAKLSSKLSEQPSAPQVAPVASKSNANEFNPAIGIMIDAVASAKTRDKSDFEFRSAELSLSANIDPFAKGYAHINGTEDGVEVEEAAIVTTALPYNLAIKGGRFFADFGRLSTFHDHDLPFVNRPVALDRFVGGESQADGVEVSYLLPIDHYVNLTGGVYDKIGGDNDRTDNAESRGWNQFTYLGRANTSFDLSDADEVAPGVSYAFTPDIESEGGSSRSLAGVDLTFRHTPLDSASYNGFIWSTEYLFNNEDRALDAESTGDESQAEFRTRSASGLYSYAELKLSRRYSPGFLFDWAQDLDRIEGDTTGYSPYLSVWISEFQRLRLQYTYEDAPGSHDNQLFLQWTAALGNHAHGFRQR